MAEQMGLSFIMSLIDNISSPLVKIGSAFDAMNQKYEGMGKGMREMGKRMSLSVTAPIVGWGGFAVHEGAKLEEAFLEVQDRFHGTKEELKALQQGIISLSMASPHSAEALSEVAAAALQIGVAKDKLPGFAKMMADFGMVADMSGREASQALKEFAAVTHSSYDDYERILSVSTKLGHSMNTTASRVLETSRQIGGLASMAGTATSDIMALSAWMNSMGQDAGMQMQQMIDKFYNAANFARGTQLGIFGKVLYGDDPEAAKKFQQLMAKSPAEAIALFVDRIKSLKMEGADVAKILEDLGLGSTRMVVQMMREAQNVPELTKALKDAREEWLAHNYLTEAAALRYGTFNAEMKKLRSTQAALGVQFATIMLPVLKWLVGILTSLAQNFTNLPDWFKYVVVGALALTAAIGPLILIMGMFMGGVAALMPVVLPVIGILASLSAIVLTLATNWKTLTSDGAFKDFIGWVSGKGGVDRSGKGWFEAATTRSFSPGSLWDYSAGGMLGGGNQKSEVKLSIALQEGLAIKGLVNDDKTDIDIFSPVFGQTWMGF
jgi:TP901 family phage tail tape measure protein